MTDDTIPAVEQDNVPAAAPEPSIVADLEKLEADAVELVHDAVEEIKAEV